LSLSESDFETNSNALSGQESLEVPSGVEVFDFTNLSETAVGLFVGKALDMIQDELGSLVDDPTKVNEKDLGVNTWLRSSVLNNDGKYVFQASPIRNIRCGMHRSHCENWSWMVWIPLLCLKP